MIGLASTVLLSNKAKSPFFEQDIISKVGYAGNFQLCEKIEDIGKRDECYSAAAYHFPQRAPCEKISNEKMRDYCIKYQRK